jgi:hypothetical protein
VEKNITEDFFIRYKIPIDCADVPCAARWIYARIAHLPAAASTKEGKLIGKWQIADYRFYLRIFRFELPFPNLNASPSFK